MAAPIRKLLHCARCFRASHPARFLYRYTSTSSTQNLTSVLEDPSAYGSSVVVSGWVKSVREHKDHVFLHISDGSGPQPLQVVTTPHLMSRISGVTSGSCVTVQGQLVPSPAKGQAVEVVADSISLLGPCDNSFPFGVGHKHSADYCRGFLHLRPRTESFTSLLRLRSAATALFHAYFQAHGYLYVHTPVITTNDCEGGGEVFAVERAKDAAESDTGDSSQSESDQEEEKGKGQFFNEPAYLTVSGQLHLEAVASAVSKVYNFGPTFRAENSRGRHHLSEFYMVEAEVAFLDTLDDLLHITEDLIKSTCAGILAEHQKDVEFYARRQGSQHHKELVERAVNKPFTRITYTDAVGLLQKHNNRFQFKVEWGSDLKKEHEKFLTKYLGDIPVFVTDFPVSLKPFYAKANDDGDTVAAVDLLVPGVGELIGGSLREDDLDLLSSRLEKLGMKDQYRWYLDLRRYGSSPHGGFGLGFERFLQFLLGTPNIKDTIPFPRWSRNCQL